MGEQHDGISRPAAVAGYFYPEMHGAWIVRSKASCGKESICAVGQAAELAARFGQESELPEAARRPLMLLLPHAPGMYTAARRYARLWQALNFPGVWSFSGRRIPVWAGISASGPAEHGRSPAETFP